MTAPARQQPATQPLVEGVSTLYGISWEQFKTIPRSLHERERHPLLWLWGLHIESPETASGTPDESDLTPSALKRKSPTDIVIEVIITSGRLDQKELYRPKKVPEVWFWRKGEITLFHLGEQGYEPRNRSEFFPDLDLSVLKRYLDYDDQYDAVSELINAIRAGEL